MGCRNFESYIGPKIRLGIYETTMHFFGPQTCKTPDKIRDFWGGIFFALPFWKGSAKKMPLPYFSYVANSAATFRSQAVWGGLPGVR